MRESRYFTALKAYKHGARGRKSRCLWSKRPRSAGSPGSLSRSPEHGSGSTESRSRSTRVGARGARAPERSLGAAASAPLRQIAAHGPQPAEPRRLQMQRPALRRPGPRQPLRTMGSADRGNRAAIGIPARIPSRILPSHPRSLPASSHRILAPLPTHTLPGGTPRCPRSQVEAQIRRRNRGARAHPGRRRW